MTTAPTLNSVPRVKKEDTIVSWSDSEPLRVTSCISTSAACLLPAIAITALSQLYSLRQMLGCFAGFTIVFALGLIVLTQGTSSRAEIFAVAAALSVVMVVFISVPPPAKFITFVPPGSPTPSVTAIISG
ncbi:hypothetical protein P154DRAFT_567391 [Amniculicola lignicola CBS 123094]|uniref:DUF6594 domain-containing protein n=1 Tax=Amniculicola lignicola CBS 123094 TaxID=1392246 RepID=A0A6A5W098_9PLEO|nr:hypothetical protein P154DRAFT_567391 [Amniculicola lignicola CBS 123094]